MNEREPKVNYVSVAHKIILFTETKPTKHELHTKTQLNKYSIYDKSMRFMLLHFGNNSKNARLHFGKAHSNNVCSFFYFYVYDL